MSDMLVVGDTYENTEDGFIKVKGSELNGMHVLLMSNGWQSAILFIAPFTNVPGKVQVETENGPLYLDPDTEYVVYPKTSLR